MATMELGIEYVADEWEPHGLSCMDCSAVFREGDRYTERLASFAEDAPIVELVCLDCGTARSPVR
jgi:RNase P subunit RPR2